MPNKDYPTVEFVRQCLRYEDGKLFWLQRPMEHFANRRDWHTWNSKLAGREAGSLSRRKNAGDRWALGLHGWRILRYRLIWAILNGEWPVEIDHKNRISTDDRIENLRLADQSQNLANAKPSSRNTSGCKGVGWNKARSQWRVRIVVRGKEIHLGFFDEFDQAIAAYKAGARHHYGEYASD